MKSHFIFLWFHIQALSNHGLVTFFSPCLIACFYLRCCGGMDCNCVSDLLLPPVPALWTPGQSHHHAQLTKNKRCYFSLLTFVVLDLLWVWLKFVLKKKVIVNVQKSNGKNKQKLFWNFRNIAVIIIITCWNKPQIFSYLKTLTIHMHID